MVTRPLVLWNGRPMGVLPSDDWEGVHVYVAAYSIDDARRVCLEAGLRDPGRYEIAKYWVKGCWGDRMSGVEVVRGLWIGRGYNKGEPERILKRA
jgi:hypothetical protein